MNLQLLPMFTQKRNKRNTLDYSTLLLQTDSKPPQEALLYSASKRRLLADSEQSHTPVKIQRYTFTSDGKKVIINDMTTLSVPDKMEYSFQYDEGATQSSIKKASIKDVVESFDEYDYVTVHAKAVSVGQTITIGTKHLQLAQATFVDETGSIGVDLWEQHIPQVTPGKVYNISFTQVREWNGKKKVINDSQLCHHRIRQ